MITDQVTDFVWLNYTFSHLSVLIWIIWHYLCYQILKEPDHSYPLTFIIRSSSSKLSPASKLIHHRSTNSVTHHFFFIRVPCLWNELPNIDISFPTSTLISRLKTYFWQHFEKTFEANWQHQPLYLPFTLPL